MNAAGIVHWHYREGDNNIKHEGARCTVFTYAEEEQAYERLRETLKTTGHPVLVEADGRPTFVLLDDCFFAEVFPCFDDSDCAEHDEGVQLGSDVHTTRLPF